MASSSSGRTHTQIEVLRIRLSLNGTLGPSIYSFSDFIRVTVEDVRANTLCAANYIIHVYVKDDMLSVYDPKFSSIPKTQHIMAFSQCSKEYETDNISPVIVVYDIIFWVDFCCFCLPSVLSLPKPYQDPYQNEPEKQRNWAALDERAAPAQSVGNTTFCIFACRCVFRFGGVVFQI